MFASFPSATAAASDGTETAYDGLGRVKEVEETVSPYATTTYAYLSDNGIQVTNPRGKSTTTTYFALGAPDTSLPTVIQQPEGVTTTIVRNDFGEMTSVTQGGGGVSATRTYRYDSRHNMCRQIDPETGSTVYSYDDAGRLEWYAQAAAGSTGACNLSSVPASQRVVHSYDTLNRLTLLDYPDSAPDVTYGYDDNGNLATLDNSSANRTYSYNKLNALESESLVTGGQTFDVSYQFDTQDRLTKITYPTGLQVPITPNAYGTPKSVGSYASGIGYHPNGAIASLTYGTSPNRVYTLSQTARQLPDQLEVMEGSTAIADLTHSYDENGNITRIVDGVHGLGYERTMGYDDLDRLTSASGHWGSGSYTYDALGNITTKTEGGETMTYHYDTNNRLTHITGASPMPYGTQDFSYNRAGNMTSSTNPSITYQYDGHQRRVQQTQGGQTEYTMYSQSGTLLHKKVGGVTTDYIYAGQMLIAKKSSATGTHYLQTDLLGSPIEGKVGSTGYSEYYTPWGEKQGDPIQLADDVGYTGHQSDTATGLTYMQARYYDPVVGRFMSTDPVGFTSGNPMSFNRYSYVNNNPCRFTDPTGMAAYENGPKDRQEESNKRCLRNPNCMLYRSGWSSSTSESPGEQSGQTGLAKKGSDSSGPLGRTSSVALAGNVDDFDSKGWGHLGAVLTSGTELTVDAGQVIGISASSPGAGPLPTHVWYYEVKARPLDANGDLANVVAGPEWFEPKRVVVQVGMNVTNRMAIRATGGASEHGYRWYIRIPIASATHGNNSGGVLQVYSWK